MREHIGNELDLMLKKIKPLSMFYYSKQYESRDMIPFEAFFPYVQDGSIISSEFEIGKEAGNEWQATLTYVLYALPEEAWRIPAMRIALMAQATNFYKPDEGIDRVIGLLLGYTRESIDDFVRQGIASDSYNKLQETVARSKALVGRNN